MSEPVSVDCAQVDINALCEKMRVAAFDLDGTLARSKKPIIRTWRRRCPR